MFFNMENKVVNGYFDKMYVREFVLNFYIIFLQNMVKLK